MQIKEFRENYKGTAQGFMFDLALADSLVNNTELFEHPLIKFQLECPIQIHQQ